MKRTTLSLIAGTAALAAVTGFAVVFTPEATGSGAAGAAASLPVERTGLTCPAPSTSDLAETTYTSFTPVAEGAESDGEAELTAAGEQDDEAVLKPEEPGTPVTTDVSGGEATALIGTAEGRFAPGWTVQQTTEVAAGTGRGLLGFACGQADTEFWFPGASTDPGRTDYVHLTNPDDSAAVVDIELYGADGAVESTVGEGITVAPHGTESVLLSTLSEEAESDLTVHVGVRSGRVGAAVQALHEKLGGDWLAASTDPAGSLVLPGIPADAEDVRLVVFTPGDTDADLQVRLASPTGLITPAGQETVRAKAGRTTAVDLADVTRGEAGSLVLTPTDGSVPVVAAARVVRGENSGQETAFIPATSPVETRATAVDNRAEGTTLSVTAPKSAAKVKVTASAGSEGGAEATKTYTIAAGTTQNVEIPVPEGLKGTYALTVEPVSGGPVYAARTLTATEDDVSAFTVQTLPDDRGTVSVPVAEEDLSVLQE